VQSFSGRELASIDINSQAKVSQLKKEFHQHQKKYYPDRQRFFLGKGKGSAVLQDDKLLSDYHLKDGSILIFKDLGPQISWQMVFIIEYFGPLVLYPILFLQPTCIYGQVAANSTPSLIQKIALGCWTFHYLKRELETLFVHRFSHATMPYFNLVKNCSYYWGMALAVAYFVNHPLHTPPPIPVVYAGLAVFILCELGNFWCHMILRNLRPASSTQRQIPEGFIFSLVSCPNYTLEIFAWIAFAVMTQTLTAYLFMIVGAAQMTIWAQQKHSRYHKEFNGKGGVPQYPKNRKIIFPFIY